MKRLLAVAALLSALLAYIPQAVSAQPIWLYFDSVVRIAQSQAAGSGYIVGDNHVQTAGHVVGEAELVWVKAGPLWSHGAVRCRNQPSDSSSVETLATERGKALPVAPALPEVGEHVYVAGWPRGAYTERATVVKRYVLFIEVNGLGTVGPVAGVDWDEVMPLGISGGPAVNMKGEVWGTAVAARPGLVWIVPLESAKCRTILTGGS